MNLVLDCCQRSATPTGPRPRSFTVSIQGSWGRTDESSTVDTNGFFWGLQDQRYPTSWTR